jgi:hypothetical protein
VATRPDMVFKKRSFSITMMFNKIADKLSFDVGRKSKDWDGKEHNLDIEALSLQNIRRSKIIYLLQFKHLNPQGVQEILDKNQFVDLAWLTQISRQIYGESE